MATKKPTNKSLSTKDKLKAKGLVRFSMDITEQTKNKIWEPNLKWRYTSTDEFKPYFERLVNALALHKDCKGIIERIMSGK